MSRVLDLILERQLLGSLFLLESRIQITLISGVKFLWSIVPVQIVMFFSLSSLLPNSLLSLSFPKGVIISTG